MRAHRYVCIPCQAAPLYSVSVLIKGVRCQSQAGAPQDQVTSSDFSACRLKKSVKSRDLMKLELGLFKPRTPCCI